MANRYWVGGSGTWDTTTTHWSATSGGAGGASVPTSADAVFIDANSGSSPVITVSLAAAVVPNCLSLDFTGAITPTFSLNYPMQLYGNLTFISTMTLVQTATINFLATTTGRTITTAGISFGNNIIIGGNTSCVYTLQDNLTLTGGTMSLLVGTLDLNGKTLNVASFGLSTTNTRTLTMGSATVNVTGGNWDNTTSTGLTLNAGTSTINMSSNSSSFIGGGMTYNNLTISATNVTVSGTNTISTLTIGAGKSANLAQGVTQTITNIVSNGVKGNRAKIQSDTAASTATINTTAIITASHLTIQDITKTGTGVINARSSQNVSNNSGINFLDRYWIGGTGSISDITHWATYSGGTSGASAPTSSDNVYFDSASFSVAGQIVTVDAAMNCLDMDWTGATNNPTLAHNSALNIYGSATFIASMSRTGAQSLNFYATTTGFTFTSGGLSFSAIGFGVVGSGGGWTLQDNVISSTGEISLTNGTLNTNGKTLNIVDFKMYTGTKTLVLGASIINVSGNWTLTTATTTLNAGTSTINMTGAAKTFAGGGLTYNNVTFSGTPLTVTGSNTFATLTIALGKTISLTSGTTQTVTSLVCNGTTAAPSTLQSVTAASPATIVLPAGRYFIRHTSIKDITVSGATAVTSIAGTNVSGNTGITFVTKFEMGRIKNDGSFNWYNTSTGVVSKVSG